MNPSPCVVLDTNVLVSAILSELGAPARILDLVLGEHLSLGYDDRILEEYRDVLCRPELKLDTERVDAVLRACERQGVQVASFPWPLGLPDRDDEIFLSAADTLRAPLVTGNIRHYPLSRRKSVRVLSPREFLDTCC